MTLPPGMPHQPSSAPVIAAAIRDAGREIADAIREAGSAIAAATPEPRDVGRDPVDGTTIGDGLAKVAKAIEQSARYT